MTNCVINYLLYNKQIEERMSFPPFIQIYLIAVTALVEIQNNN